MRTIAWDVDDVLNDFQREWFDRAWLPGHPHSPVRSYSALTENPPDQILGVGREEYLESVDGFRRAVFEAPLRPSPAALAWFERHGTSFRHVVLTAIPRYASGFWAQWVLDNFGRWIQVFACVPSPRPSDGGPPTDATKGDLLRWMANVNVLVDDNPGNIEAAESLGLKGFLYPRPWNGQRLSAESLLEQVSAQALAG